MKKAVAFFLLFSICYCYLGSLMLVEVRLISVIQKMHLKREKNAVITLLLKKSEFDQYSKDDNELCIKGEWYDIKKTVNSGSEILVYCIHDKTETSILADLENFFNHSIPKDKSPVSNMLFKFLGLFYIPSFHDSGIKSNVLNVFCSHIDSLKTLSAFFPVSTPPPRG